MDGSQTKAVAAEVLGLDLSEAEAASMALALAGLRRLVAEIEAVHLDYPGDPFVSPRMGDDWLERQPGE